MGRNIFQSNNPSGMIKAVKAIVHEGATTGQAYEIYQGK
jgi:3-hydroxy-5-phosphonooxypentane-2,4-dione thiolase